MRDTGYYLGFPSLVLAACVVLPLIGFIIRRKWRLAVVRKEEIKRLLVLAAEEAARAELEAAAGYGAGAGSTFTVPISTSYHQCAVCYSPTTTRCARCKAVRYCSGKCQIIHWRKGHKEECHPPRTTQWISDARSKVSDSHEINGDDSEIEGKYLANPIKTLPGDPALSKPGRSPEFPCKKVDSTKAELLQESRGTNSDSETSGVSFSGFSASTTGGEASDDASMGESLNSSDSGRSDVHLPVDNSLDMLETTRSIKNMSQSQPLSPKFASSVDSVVHHTKSSKLNEPTPDCDEGKHRCASSRSLGLGSCHLNEDSIAEPCAVSPGFWGTTLGSVGSTSGATDKSTPSNCEGVSNTKLSDSESSLHFSFNLSETTCLNVQDAKVKGTVSEDSLPYTLGISKPAHAAALSENNCDDALKVKNSTSLNYEGSSRTYSDAGHGSHTLKGRDSESLSASSSYVPLSSSIIGDSISSDALHISNLRSSSSERSRHIADDPGNTHLLNSMEVGCISSGSINTHLAFGAQGHSPAVIKPGKVDGVQASAAISSQVRSGSPNARSGLKTSVRKAVDQFRGSKLSKHYPLSDECEVAGRYTDKGIVHYNLFVKLCNWNKAELRPFGLINCGNSCYANAVLQCLAFTPPLTAYFLQGLHFEECAKKEGCFTCEFESLILKAKEGNSPHSPIRILSQLRKVGSQLGNGREEDAHEFLRYAIDTMQSICLKEAGLNASDSLEEETTLIGLTFGGYLRSKIKCTKCQGKSERQERMMDLTVEIEGDIETLEEALHRFTGTEILDGENKYQCSRCKSYERAKKKLTIMEAPNILTIALKRFQSGKFGKLNKPIRFPEILDLAPFISGTSDKSPIYRLYGVVVHLDIMNASFSGHYVCYVKNIQNKWFEIDDSIVTPVELQRVLTKGAYMLLYARCSPRAPRLIRNRIISSDPKNKAIPSWINGKNATSRSRPTSTHASVAQNFPCSIPKDRTPSFESFYARYLQVQRIMEEDSSSDNSSLISSNSDEGSCSTDATRDSTSTDELSDFIFGDSGRSWNSPSRNPYDSDTSSSSSSPLCSTHSPHSYSEQNSAPSFPKTTGPQSEGSIPFLHSDTTRHCRKLVTSSSCRETDSARLGLNPFHDVCSGVSCSKSTRERTD